MILTFSTVAVDLFAHLYASKSACDRNSKDEFIMSSCSLLIVLYGRQGWCLGLRMSSTLKGVIFYYKTFLVPKKVLLVSKIKLF